jgi:O-antigen/teichoic acid export membrane protein
MRLSDVPVKEFSFVVGSVMFPLFSKLDRSGRALRDVFMKTLKYTGAVAVPMAIGMSVFGPPLIAKIYGAKWEPMAGPLRVLALYAVFRSLSSVIYDAFKATGRPQLMQRFVIFRLVCVATLGIPALKVFGLMGICLLILATYASVFVWEMRVLTGYFEVGLWSGLLLLLRPLALSLTIIPGGYLALVELTGDAAIVQLVVAMALTGMAYVAAYVWLDRDSLRDLQSIRASKATTVVA